jgi:thioredoxin reductase
VLQKKGIQVVEDSITALVGKNGMLEGVVFATREQHRCDSGFVAPQQIQVSPFGALLACDLNALGGPVTDNLGRTSVKGVYVAGEVIAISQLIIAAAQGSMAAVGVNMDLIESEFLSQMKKSYGKPSGEALFIHVEDKPPFM